MNALLDTPLDEPTLYGTEGEARFVRERLYADGYTFPSRKHLSCENRALQILHRIGCGFSDCWYWMGNLDALGYGRVGGSAWLGENRAHRASYRIFHGDIAAGKVVMHSCDVRCCVNPHHLTVGTQRNNVGDMWKRGRANVTPPSRGGSSHLAKLTEWQVRDIRTRHAAGVPQRVLAKEFGVAVMTIYRAVNGISWSHLD